MVGEDCVPRRCSVRNPFPIHDINGHKALLDNGKKNTKYIKPPVLVGTCANIKVDKANKASHGSKCYLVSSVALTLTPPCACRPTHSC